MADVKKALVIDDSPDVAAAMHRLVRQVLPRDGWAVQHVTDPKLGLSIAVLDQGLRIVFVDSVMPILNGDDLIEQALRRRPGLRGRIVVCSGLWFEEHRERRLFRELGCLRLDKPFRLEQLEQVVYQVLSVPPVPGAE